MGGNWPELREIWSTLSRKGEVFTDSFQCRGWFRNWSLPRHSELPLHALLEKVWNPFIPKDRSSQNRWQFVELREEALFQKLFSNIDCHQSCNSGSNFFPEKIPRDCSARLFAKKWRKSPTLALTSLLAKKRKKIGENPLLAACTHSFAILFHNQQQSSLLDRAEIFLCSTKWYILTPTTKTWLHWFWKVTSLYEWAKHSLYTSTLLSMDILNEGGGGEERINWLKSKE